MDSVSPLLAPGEVAAMFRVDPKTVTRWANAGKVSSYRTPGGHRRYRQSDIENLLNKSFEAGGQGISGGGQT